MLTDSRLIIATVAHLATFPGKPITVGRIADCFGLLVAKVRSVFAAYPRLVAVLDEDVVETPLQNEHLLCYRANKGTCSAPGICQRLHVCCARLYQRCAKDSSSCDFDHELFGQEANVAVLESLGVRHWPTADVKLLILCLEKETALLCKFYNEGQSSRCTKGAGCEYLHVCAAFVNSENCNGSCGRNHRFGQAENLKKIQKLHGLELDDVVDDPPQLHARISLKLANRPKVASYDALVTDHLGQHGNKLKKFVVHPKTADVWFNGPAGVASPLLASNVLGISLGLEMSLLLNELKRTGVAAFRNIFCETGPNSYNLRGPLRLPGLQANVVVHTSPRQLRQDIPTVWMPMTVDGDVAVLCQLGESDEEFKKVRDCFFDKLDRSRFKLLKVYRVQNPHLWACYRSRKAQLTTVYSQEGVTLNEMMLFHGARHENARSVCLDNFDWRRSGENAEFKHGQGVSFASDLTHSHSCSTPGDDGTRVVFLSRVLVGVWTTGTSSVRYPPVWKSGIHYDTTVNVQVNPTIFVKYQNSEYYPAYLIMYSSGC